MPIEVNSKANIKFEGTSLVVEKAFQLDGVYHNIVLKDGNRTLSRNNLKWAPVSQICQEITSLYLKCVERAMDPKDCGLAGPLENARFVYKNVPNSTEGSLTQMFWRQQAGHEVPFMIGTQDINRSMGQLIKNFSIYEMVKGKAPEPSKSKTSPSTDAASSFSSGSSLIPDFLLSDDSSPVPTLKVAPPSSSKPKKPLIEEEGELEASSCAVKVAPPLPKNVESQVAKKQEALLDSHKLAKKAQEVERIAEAYQGFFPKFKPFKDLFSAIHKRATEITPVEEG